MLPLNPLCRRLQAFRKPSTNDSVSHESRIAGHDLWTFLYLGFLGVTVNQVCFTIGLRFTSVSHSAIIVTWAPSTP